MLPPLMHDPVMFAIPFFLLLLIIEWAAARKLAHTEAEQRARRGLPEARRVGQHLDGPGVDRHQRGAELIALFGYAALYVYVAPWHLPANQWYTWVIAIVGVDLLYYCYHRMAHRVRLIWATHQAHHSSQYFNFATALRQKWNISGDILMWALLPLFGVPPWMVFASFSINLIYQFWIHTERIGKLWRPIEFVFNTPSHHRVHHGMDQEYLDKNYGGILILWDRLFGSFQPRPSRPHYGLTKQVDTYNIWKLQTHEYVAIARDVRGARAVARQARLHLRPARVGAAAQLASRRRHRRGQSRFDSVPRRIHAAVPPRSVRGVETVFDAHVDPALIERSLAASTFGSMWLDIAAAGVSAACPASITCDLLVVGGGYTGLWTALHAAQRNPDRRIVLIEANRIGWAASGRNGGFVDASLTHGLENGKSRWPNEIDTLEAMGMENLDGMQAEIAELGLDAEWQRTGMLSVATEPHQVEWLAEAAAEGEGQFLDQSEVRDEVHSPTYLAGLFDPDTCAIVHPAKLAFELARACRTRGVHDLRAHQGHGARLRRRRAAHRHRRAAIVTASQAVLATNVFPSLLRRNRLHTVPVYDYVLATEPLTDAQLDRIGWRNRQGIGDCANQFHYYRADRWTTGSCGAATTPSTTSAARSTPRTRTGPQTYRRLAAHFFITFPAARRRPVQPSLGGRHRHQHPVLRALGTRPRRPGRLRQRVHRARRRRRPVRRRRVPGPAGGRADAAHRAGDGAQAAAAVSAGAAGQHRYPGHPMVAGSRRPLRGQAQRLAAHPGRGRPRLRLLMQ